MLNYSRNSLLAKFWCWFYVKKTKELPRSICPYFWKYVVLIIAFIPVMLIAIPCIMVELIWPDFKEDAIDGVGPRIAFGMVFHLSIQALISMGCAIESFFIGTGPAKSAFETYCQFGFVFIACSIIAGIIYLIHIYRKSKIKYDQWGYEIEEPKEPNLFVQGVKDFYRRHCTPINWVD